MTDATRPQGLARSSGQGALWAGAQSLVIRLLSLAGFVVLARLLTPTEYGLAALATFFVGFLQLLGSAGLSAALVQRPDVDDIDLDSVFWMAMGISVILALGLCGLAYPLSSVFDEPDLRPVLQVLSVTFVCIGFGTTHFAVLQKRLAFKAIAKSTMVANLAATTVGIAAAFAGAGVYALVVQTVIAPALAAGGYWLQSGFRPRLQASGERMRGIFRSSRHFFGAQFMTYSNERTSDLLIGGVLGTATLGIFTIANRVLTVMNEMLVVTAKQVALPVFSKLQDDRVRLRAAFLSATSASALIATPAFLLALVAAPEIVELVFGRTWLPSVDTMRILCIYGPLYAVLQLGASLLQSVGRARFVFRFAAVGTVVQLVGFAVAVPFGIEWVALALVVRAYLLAPIELRVTARELGLTLGSMTRQYGPIVLAGCCLLAAGFASRSLAEQSGPLLLLVVEVACGLTAYAAIMLTLGRSQTRSLVGFVRGAVRRLP